MIAIINKLLKPAFFQWTRQSSSFLGNLEPLPGAVDNYKRLGRGQASGKGKTAGRGQKGQKARGKVPSWFEGGQTPFYKRFPVVGFKRPHKKIYKQLNLKRIQEFWNNGRISLQKGDVLDIKAMRQYGLITGSFKDGVKILGNGKYSYNVPLNIQASKASIDAISAIEKAGNTYESKYFTKLSLRGHIDPDSFYLKKGYLPLEPRPIHRRDVTYYSDVTKRGYLLNHREIFLDLKAKNTKKVNKVIRKSQISLELEKAATKAPNYSESTIIKLSDL